MKLVIIGARPDGGVAGVLEIARRQGHDVIGLIDDHLPAGPSPLGLPILGDREEIPHVDSDGFCVCIGDNHARRELFELAEQAGLQPVTLTHPTACVSDSADIGPGSVLFAGSVIGAGTRTGRSLILNTLASLDHDNLIGDFVNVSPGVHTAGRVTLEAGVFLGIGVTVVPDVTIPTQTFIRAGTTVTKRTAIAETMNAHVPMNSNA